MRKLQEPLDRHKDYKNRHAQTYKINTKYRFALKYEISLLLAKLVRRNILNFYFNIFYNRLYIAKESVIYTNM